MVPCGGAFAGMLTLIPDEYSHTLLQESSEQYALGLSDKYRLPIDKIDPETLARMMRMIVPFRFAIESVDGTWKPGQNKAAATHQRIAATIKPYGHGTDVKQLAGLTGKWPNTKE